MPFDTLRAETYLKSESATTPVPRLTSRMFDVRIVIGQEFTKHKRFLDKALQDRISPVRSTMVSRVRVTTMAILILSLDMTSRMKEANSADKPAVKSPNILFIYADDQSYKTISCYPGAPDWVRTPNIDRLAARGIRFERSYLGAWCMPSRASLLTGKLQHAVQSMSMEGTYPGSTYDPKQCPFVPAEFRKKGYHTAQIGKWHTGTDTGFGRDWDFQIVWNRPLHTANAGKYYDDQILTFNGEDRLTKGYSTDNYSQWAAEYIQGKHRDANKPWYLWLCYGAIHGPTIPAERHLGKLAGKSAPIPQSIFGPRPDKPSYLQVTQAWMRGPDGLPALIKRTRGNTEVEPGKSFEAWIQQVNECNMAVDEGVGKVLAALETSGELENTLVVYTADQGFGLGEHGLNQKVAPYDAAISSPLIVSWEGRIPAGKVCRHPVNSPDLIDLFCHTAGVEVPWKTHGRDIRPLLRDPESTRWKEPMIFTHTGRNYGAETNTIPKNQDLGEASNVPWYALLRDGRFKYVRNLTQGETEELYDLDADPDELTNLANRLEHRTLLTDLRGKTIDQLHKTDAGFVAVLPKTRLEMQADQSNPK